MAHERLLAAILNRNEDEALSVLAERQNMANYTHVVAAPPEKRFDINMLLEAHGGKTFLMLAAEKDLFDVVHELIQQHANVNAGDYIHNTVLDYAEKDSKTYKLLVKHGAAKSHPGSYLGNS